jgi:hypothetical protein
VQIYLTRIELQALLDGKISRQEVGQRMAAWREFVEGGMTIDAAGQRIIVLGCSGSGKSTLAVALAARLGLPFVPTDDIYWRGAWQPTPPDEVRAWLRGTTMRENWVLDGNFDAQRDLAWSRANLIVWLDFPLPTVMLRVLRRNLTWWLTGATVWGGQRMTLRKAVDGARHALTSHGLKRRDYPAWLASLDGARAVRLRSPGAVVEWLGTEDERTAEP